MEIGLDWDDDFFESKKEKKENAKNQPYNVKICEKQYFFTKPLPKDDLQRQNITKWQADYWYRNGHYKKAIDVYIYIQKNPQIKSTTVERDIDESVIRCHLKLGNISNALICLRNLIESQGEDTSMFLLLAEICSVSKHIQGEIACFKRCISLHSYNHNFWYSLAKAYRKAHNAVQTIHSSNIEIDNDGYEMVNAILLSNTANIYKDCLKFVVNCSHCICSSGFSRNQITKGYDKVFLSCEEGQSLNHIKGQSKECLTMVSQELKEKLTVKGNYSFGEKSNACSRHLITRELSAGKLQSNDDHSSTEYSMKDLNNLTRNTNHHTNHYISSNEVESNEVKEGMDFKNESNSHTETTVIESNGAQLTSSQSCNEIINKTYIYQEVPYISVGQEKSGCHFNMSIMKSTDCEMHPISRECRLQGLSLLVFFCLLRTRFLLQRAIWTSTSFVKERLSLTMSEVKKDIKECVMCDCGELKKCILKQMTHEDTCLSGQQIDQLDMHSLYQEGKQKHWT